MRLACGELGGVAHKWFKIGIQLGIPLDVLKNFKNDDDPLASVIHYWLTGNVKDKAVQVSWETVVTALESTHLEESALADKISKKYCQQAEDAKVKKGN